MIELIVKGVPYTDFTDISVNVAIRTLSNDFAFTASAVAGFPPFKQGDEVVISVEGEKKITGFIDEVNGVDQEGSHAVTYTGRDKTGDLIDSQIDKIDELRPDSTLTLKRVIELVIANIGADIKVIDNVSPVAFNVAEDRIDPQPGQDAIDFIQMLARKRQVLLTSNGDGDIEIIQSSPIDSGAIVQRLQNEDTNNIISQSWSINGSELFNRYTYRGQLDPRALNFGGVSGIASVENQGARVTFNAVRAGRSKVVVESDSYSDAQLEDRVKWAKQLSKARSTRFNCSVKGHRSSVDSVYQENTLVQVNSDVADITRKMLLDGIEFTQGEGIPTATALEFVERDVYTIDEKLLSQKPVGGLNDIFKSLG